jgi:hypothetical protein
MVKFSIHARRKLPMTKILCLALWIIFTLTACNQSSDAQDGQVGQSARVKIMLNGEMVALAKPPLLLKDVVYVSKDDISSLPGIAIEYNQSTGEITTKRLENTFIMNIGQPLKVGDKNGPVPFLQQEIVYIPFCDTISHLNYNAQTDKSSDGTIIITLEKFGFDVVDYMKMVTGVKFSVDELKAAETALTQGITITDPQNDWALISEGVQGDGRKDNGKPYPIAFTDIKSVTLGADSLYLYLKYEFYAMLPEKLVYHDNPDLGKTDFISGLGGGFFLSQFYNRNTGKNDEGGMSISITWVQNDSQQYTDKPNVFTPPIVNIQNQATLTGSKFENGDDRYKVDNNNGRVAGGAGTSYIIGAFPLKEFGLQFGDTVEGSMGIEVGSKLFHHECCDVALDCGYKAGATIRYKLGTNSYENLGPPDNMIPLNTLSQGK